MQSGRRSPLGFGIYERLAAWGTQRALRRTQEMAQEKAPKEPGVP
jgi:hypothetical protein